MTMGDKTTLDLGHNRVSDVWVTTFYLSQGSHVCYLPSYLSTQEQRGTDRQTDRQIDRWVGCMLYVPSHSVSKEIFGNVTYMKILE